MRPMPDPAAAVSTGSTLGATTTATSQAQAAQVAPDDIWAQCGIQFRLQEYVQVVNATLATQITNTCSCGALNGPTNPIASILNAQPTNVINVYMGGVVPSGCGGGDTSGITCGASNSLGGGACALTTGQFTHLANSDRDAILLNQQFPFAASPQVTFAHELGHFIGLTHSPRTFVDPMGMTQNLSQCLPAPNGAEDTVGVPNLLMAPGGGTGTPTISPMQCARSRCMAARWLETFAPSAAATARRVSVCAE